MFRDTRADGHGCADPVPVRRERLLVGSVDASGSASISDAAHPRSGTSAARRDRPRSVRRYSVRTGTSGKASRATRWSRWSSRSRSARALLPIPCIASRSSLNLELSRFPRTPIRGRVHFLPRRSTVPAAGSMQYSRSPARIIQTTSRVNARSRGLRLMRFPWVDRMVRPPAGIDRPSTRAAAPSPSQPHRDRRAAEARRSRRPILGSHPVRHRYSIQQLIRLISWWNDSAAIFNASEKVGNVWTVSIMSSTVRPPRMAYAAACTMSAAIGETM